jgi:hypothetical protein
VARRDKKATQHDLEATDREFKMLLLTVEAWRRCRSGGNAGKSTDRAKPLKFDWSASWAVFYHQFKASANHDCTSRKKAADLLTILQGQAANIIHSVPTGAAYQDTISALEGRYGDHQLTAAYQSQLKARMQLSGKSLQ